MGPPISLIPGLILGLFLDLVSPSLLVLHIYQNMPPEFSCHLGHPKSERVSLDRTDNFFRFLFFLNILFSLGML